MLARGPEQVEWSKWLPKAAVNAHMVMSAYLPSLAHQFVWHATSLPDVLQNFLSIFMGVGALDYPDAWWKQTLKSAIRTLHLGDHTTVSMWTFWVQLGRHWTVLWSSHTDACYPALPAALDMQRTDGGRLGGSQSQSNYELRLPLHERLGYRQSHIQCTCSLPLL